MDCIGHGVAKSQTHLSNFHFHLVHLDNSFNITEQSDRDSGLQDEEIDLGYVFFSIPIGKVVKSSLNFCRKGNIINQRLDPKQVTSCSLIQWSPKGPQSSLFSTECHAGPLADKILLTSPGDCY